MYNFTIIEGEIWLQGKLITKYDRHIEAVKALNNEETRKQIEQIAIKLFS